MASDELTQQTKKHLLPSETLRQLEKMMNEKYEGFLQKRTFHLSADSEDQQVSVCVTLQNEDESFVYPVQGRLNCETEDMEPDEAALFLIDYIDSYFEDFFDDEEALYLPIEWANYSYDAVDMQLKGQILNLKVERMADDLLAADKQPSPASGGFLG